MFSIVIKLIAIAMGLLMFIGLKQMIVDYFKGSSAVLKEALEEEQDKNIKIKEKLIKKYGSPFGEAMHKGEFVLGMTSKMIDAPAVEMAEVENDQEYNEDSYYLRHRFTKLKLSNNQEKWYYHDEDNSKILYFEKSRLSQIKDFDPIEYNNDLQDMILDLLRTNGSKIPASDIDAYLKHQNLEEIKEVCESMYHEGTINRTGNYRYFIFDNQASKVLKSKHKYSVADEIEKFKKLLDSNAITEEEYNIKKKKILKK